MLINEDTYFEDLLDIFSLTSSLTGFSAPRLVYIGWRLPISGTGFF